MICWPYFHQKWTFVLRLRWILNNVICHDTQLNFTDDMYVLKERLMWAPYELSKSGLISIAWGNFCLHSCSGKWDHFHAFGKERVWICIFYRVIGLLPCIITWDSKFQIPCLSLEKNILSIKSQPSIVDGAYTMILIHKEQHSPL